MDEKYRVRIKIKNEPDLILITSSNTSISELLDQIAEIKKINRENLKILHNGDIVNCDSTMQEFKLFSISKIND